MTAPAPLFATMPPSPRNTPTPAEDVPLTVPALMTVPAPGFDANPAAGITGAVVKQAGLM